MQENDPRILYMKEALRLAREAQERDEVPIGCIIVHDGKIIGSGSNRREELQQPSAHAEMEAIAQAAKALGSWRLEDCDLYVTLEPCPMCAGAIVNARIPRVVYGASDAKCGAVSSVCSLFTMDFNHHPQVTAGVLEEPCAQLLRSFFQQLRIQLRSRPKWRPRPKEQNAQLP